MKWEDLKIGQIYTKGQSRPIGRLTKIDRQGKGFSLEIIASDGRKGTWKFYSLQGMTEVPIDELLLYVSWKYTSPEFEALLKDGTAEA